MSKDNGMPAFPGTEANGLNSGCPGISMRDYFAAKAVTGLTAAQDAKGTWQYGDGANVASAAYEIADAMLAERAK